MDITNFMKEHKDTKKVFSEREIEIMEKQLSGKHLTQSEKNRLSRDVRPKLRFIRALSGYQDEFDLKKNQNNKKIIEKAVHCILEEAKDIKAILLFGDGTYTNRSDIDICVVFRNILSKKEATQFRIHILGMLPDKVDVQVFNVLSITIKKEIARNHRILYSKEFDNVAFTLRALRDDDFFIRKQHIFGAAA